MAAPDAGQDGRSVTDDLPDVFGFKLPEAQWLRTLGRAQAAPVFGRAGAFERVEEVARGGQGVVFRARESGSGRPVAIKRLLGGCLATPAARARFEREVEAAAALRHENIVTLLGVDLCNTEPMLVFEWIDGARLDEWLRGEAGGPPPMATRLQVFERICDAVQHAHQRGVIHRDLKPSNILVDAAGAPHVLDFGLAKVAGLAGAEHPTLTRSEQFVGTPGFAPPEQLRGRRDEVDAASDVYALGAVLYLLLTGRAPFAECGDLPALVEAACSVPPAPPSRLAREVNRELDAIALKALAIEKPRRYATVEALAEDVRRYLRGEPVEARRDSGLYVLRATLRRYRVPVALALATLVVALAASAALAALYAGQSRALRDAQEARWRAEQALAFVDQALESAARVGRGGDLPIRKAMLDEAAARAAAHFADQPELQAAARLSLGRAYGGLGLYREAEAHLRAALALREARDANSIECAEARFRLASLLCDVNRFAEAESMVQRVCDTRRRLLGDRSAPLAEAINLLGMIRQYHHDYDGAADLHREALRILAAAQLGESPQAADCYASLGCALNNATHYAAAEAACRAALEIRRAALGPESPAVGGSLVELAKVRFARGDYVDAETLFRESLALNRRLLGDRHDNVAWGLHRLGVLLHALARCDEARATLAESLDIYRTCYEEPLPYVPMVLESLGTMELDCGDLAAAERRFDEALAVLRAGRGTGEATLRWRRNRLAELAEARGDADAETLLRAALQAGRELDASRAAELPQLIRTMQSLARVLSRNGMHDEAERLAREALERCCVIHGETHPEAGEAMIQLGGVLARAGRADEAREWVRRGLDAERSTFAETHPRIVRAGQLLQEIESTPPR